MTTDQEGTGGAASGATRGFLWGSGGFGVSSQGERDGPAADCAATGPSASRVP